MVPAREDAGGDVLLDRDARLPVGMPTSGDRDTDRDHEGLTEPERAADETTLPVLEVPRAAGKTG